MSECADVGITEVKRITISSWDLRKGGPEDYVGMRGQDECRSFWSTLSSWPDCTEGQLTRWRYFFNSFHRIDWIPDVHRECTKIRTLQSFVGEFCDFVFRGDLSIRKRWTFGFGDFCDLWLFGFWIWGTLDFGILGSLELWICGTLYCGIWGALDLPSQPGQPRQTSQPDSPLNPKPKTQHPKPNTQNPKPKTQNTKHKTQNPKPKTLNPKP